MSWLICILIHIYIYNIQPASQIRNDWWRGGLDGSWDDGVWERERVTRRINSKNDDDQCCMYIICIWDMPNCWMGTLHTYINILIARNFQFSFTNLVPFMFSDPPHTHPPTNTYFFVVGWNMSSVFDWNHSHLAIEKTTTTTTTTAAALMEC